MVLLLSDNFRLVVLKYVDGVRRWLSSMGWVLHDGQVTASATLDPTKCRAKLLSRRSARARSPTLLTLETFDTYGNRIAWGGAAVGCKMWPVDVAGTTAVPVRGADLVQDHLDGTSTLLSHPPGDESYATKPCVDAFRGLYADEVGGGCMQGRTRSR